MKQAIFDSLDKIPEADRNDYKQVTESGSPNFNKYVLDLDPNHPVAKKNTELLGEKQTRDSQHQTAIAQKDAEITRLVGEVAVAKQSNSLPAGQISVSTEDFQKLQQYIALGDVATVKTKVDEHPVLKAKEEERTLDAQLSEIATAEGMDPAAFAKLAKDEKLADRIEVRKIDDGKGNKVTHHFVKPAEGQTGDAVALKEHVKESAIFKPFLGSLYPAKEKGSVRIPNQKTGDDAKTQDAADVYLARTYNVPEKKTAE